MFDVLSAISVCIVPLIAIGLLVLPIVALVRTIELGRRLDRLERALRREHRRAPAAEEEPVEVGADAEPPTVVPVAELAPTPPRAPEPAFSVLETLIGTRALGWIAVVLLLIAAALFLRIVIERGWIDELGRITIGVLVGTALCVAGYLLARRGWRLFSQMLTAAGIVLLFLMTFATFGFYRLMPQAPAQWFMVAVIVEALALAVLYESPAIAVMAVVGGLLTPVLLRTEEDRYVALFTYLGVLDAGVVLLVLLRGWWASATVALLGTQAIFWAWYFERYHPVKLAAAMTFQAVIFGLFVGHTILGHLVRGRPAGIESLVRLLLNAVLFATAGYVLLDPDYGDWMGTAAVVMAIIYAALAWATLVSRPDHAPLLAVTLAVSMGFLATVFPLQADAAWIAVGWAAQGLALWWFGLRIRSMALRGLGAAFLALAVGRLLVVDTLSNPPHIEPFLPVFNRYALPALGVTAAVLIAAVLSYRRHPEPRSVDFATMRVLSVAGFVLLGTILSVETYDYFVTQIATVGPVPDYEREEHLRHAAQTALSIVWSLYAVAVLLVGFRFRSQPLRWLALIVFGVTLLKVVSVDTQALTGFYRVTAYFVLALVLFAATWAYQKVKRALLPPPAENQP